MNGAPPSGALPWTHHCLVCGQDNPRGFRLRSRVDGGVVVIDYTTRPEDTGYRDLVHGGVGMTLLDEVMTWAAILAAGSACVAAEMSTRLLRPVTVGLALRVEGRVTRNARRLVLTAGRLLGPDGTALMEATGKYVPVPANQTALRAEDFVFSPATLSPAAVLGPPPAPGS